MEVSQDNKKLVELVEQARSGLLTLPEFQRNFIWWRQSIESLLDSLLRGHYIGSLLFLETDREHMPFGDRPIAGLPSASRTAPTRRISSSTASSVSPPCTTLSARRIGRYATQAIHTASS